MSHDRSHSRPYLPALWRVLVAGAALGLLAFGSAQLGAEEPAPAEAVAAPAPSAPPASPATPPAATPSAPGATTTPATAGAPGATTTPAVPVLRARIAVAETVKDVGKVRKGDKVEIEFELANQGDGPLKIKEAQPSCGCTVASFDKEIAPGKSGKVRAVLATDSFDGPIAKHVTVLSNDPDSPRLVLTIKVDVQSFLRTSPTYARILQVQSQPPEKIGLNLWATDGKVIEIQSIETPFEWVVATARRPTDAEKTPDVSPDQWRLEISLTPEAPLGPLKDAILVKTSHPEEPELEIPLSGNVRQVLHVQPAEADFGKQSKRKEVQKVVLKLFNFGKEPVELRTAESDLPFVTAAISAEEPGRRFRVELQLAPDAPKGKFEGHVTVATSSTVMPTVEIPMKGKVD